MLLEPVLREPLQPLLTGPFDMVGGSYSPVVLFTAGEQGAWYDPSDFSTMFQDSAGTTPVTATGQPVGLVLDKRLGLVRGAELRQTGATGVTGVATAATYNTATGEATTTRVDAANRSFILISGIGTTQAYELVVNNTGASTVVVRDGATVLASVLAGQSLPVRSVFASGGAQIDGLTNGTAQSFTITSFRALPGNHATQATAASRPTLQQDASYYAGQLDGIDDNLVAASGGGSTTGMFFCASIKPTAGAGVARTLWSDAGTNTGYRVRINASNQLELAAGNGVSFTTVATVGTLPVGEAHVVTAWDDGVNLNVQIDNGAVAQVARPAVSAGTASVTIGKDNGAASGFYTGLMYQQIARTSGAALDAASMSRVRRYVGARAGVTL